MSRRLTGNRTQERNALSAALTSAPTDVPSSAPTDVPTGTIARPRGPLTGVLAGKIERERGTAAVEFALLLPVLLLLVFGIIDFGRALNAQITLTQAAREGARLVALGEPNVVARTQAAAADLSPVTVTVTASCPSGAGPDADASVTTSYAFSFATPIGAIAALFGGGGIGGPITLTARGVMPCET
jgi:Flp pilus assembly protein TadG